MRKANKKVDSPGYHSKHYRSFLKDMIQRHEDDLNWAKSKRQNALSELDRVPATYTKKIESKQNELEMLNNQIAAFEMMLKNTRLELTEYERTHKTSTNAQNRKDAKGRKYN